HKKNFSSRMASIWVGCLIVDDSCSTNSKQGKNTGNVLNLFEYDQIKILGKYMKEKLLNEDHSIQLKKHVFAPQSETENSQTETDYQCSECNLYLESCEALTRHRRRRVCLELRQKADRFNIKRMPAEIKKELDDMNAGNDEKPCDVILVINNSLNLETESVFPESIIWILVSINIKNQLTKHKLLYNKALKWKYVFSKPGKFFNELVRSGMNLKYLKKEYLSEEIAINIKCILVDALDEQIINPTSGRTMAVLDIPINYDVINIDLSKNLLIAAELKYRMDQLTEPANITNNPKRLKYALSILPSQIRATFHEKHSDELTNWTAEMLIEHIKDSAITESFGLSVINLLSAYKKTEESAEEYVDRIYNLGTRLKYNEESITLLLLQKFPKINRDMLVKLDGKPSKQAVKILYADLDLSKSLFGTKANSNYFQPMPQQSAYRNTNYASREAPKVSNFQSAPKGQGYPTNINRPTDNAIQPRNLIPLPNAIQPSHPVTSYQATPAKKSKKSMETNHPYQRSSHNEQILLLQTTISDTLSAKESHGDLLKFPLKSPFSDDSINCILDTGSQNNYFPQNLLPVTLQLKPEKMLLVGYNGNPVEINGSFTWNIDYNPQTFYVVPKISLPIIGWKTISSLNSICLKQLAAEKLSSLKPQIKESIPSSIKNLLMSLPSVWDQNQSPSFLEATFPFKNDVRQAGVTNRSYIPKAHAEKIYQHFDEKVASGEMSRIFNPEVASPIVVVPKGTDDFRICMAACNINEFIHNIPINLPDIHHLLSTIPLGTKFTRLDLKAAFNQINLDENSRRFAVIRVGNRFYRCNRLQFGFNVATYLFCYGLQIALYGSSVSNPNCLDLPPLVRATIPEFNGPPAKYVIQHVDDLFIGGPDSEHEEAVMLVIRRLAHLNLKLNLEKCEFGSNATEFLGIYLKSKHEHNVISHEISISNEKLLEYWKLTPPKNLKGLQTVLGTLEFSRQFTSQYSELLLSLKNLKLSKSESRLEKEHKEMLQVLNVNLASNIKLAPLQDQTHARIDVSNSISCLSAVILIAKEGQHFKVSRVFSRWIKENEASYTKDELLVLTILEICHKFEYLVVALDTTFRMLGDNVSFHKYWYNTPNSCVATTRQTKFKFLLSHFPNIKIICQSKFTDFSCKLLNPSSVNNVSTPLSPPVESPINNLLCLRTDIESFYEDLQIDKNLLIKELKTDQDYKLLKNCLKNNNFEPLKTSNSWKYVSRSPSLLRIEGDLLYYNDRIILPRSQAPNLFSFLRKSHAGLAGMIREYRCYYFIPKFDNLLLKFFENCVTCSKFRYTKKKELIHWVPSELPNERIHMDFGQIETGKYILALVDSFSNFIYLKLTKRMTSHTVIDILRDYTKLYGTMQVLVSDNAPQFKSPDVVNYLDHLGTLQLHSPVYSPTANGFAEKAIGTSKHLIKKLKDSGSTNRDAVDEAMNCHNNTISSLNSKITPISLFLNRPIRDNKYKYITETKYLPNDVPVSIQLKKKDQWSNAVMIAEISDRRKLIKLENENLVILSSDQVRIKDTSRATSSIISNETTVESEAPPSPTSSRHASSDSLHETSQNPEGTPISSILTDTLASIDQENKETISEELEIGETHCYTFNNLEKIGKNTIYTDGSQSKKFGSFAAIVYMEDNKLHGKRLVLDPKTNTHQSAETAALLLALAYVRDFPSSEKWIISTDNTCVVLNYQKLVNEQTIPEQRSKKFWMKIKTMLQTDKVSLIHQHRSTTLGNLYADTLAREGSFNVHLITSSQVLPASGST
uniref:Integrase catalytic domain-containing protein n=1 Tax=Rhabditophanes sp. KR3021 TaxID=114890 RepID=A0AC35UH13_9BILA